MHYSLHALLLLRKSSKSVSKTFLPHSMSAQIVIPRPLPTIPTFSLRNNGEEDPEDFRLLLGSKKLREKIERIWAWLSGSAYRRRSSKERGAFVGAQQRPEKKGLGCSLACFLSTLTTLKRIKNDPHEALKMAAFSRRWQWTIIILRFGTEAVDFIRRSLQNK
eukprot:TRINITY_DN9161_c0_g2_i1.p1 TRINITY_DN9161_c0_g2~~TRINITY_DN9161_c0_g2_i1.p1  ORF type:complete len:163 (+),score=13.44 TRINITY_DN9161_c0_g2_i1:90-578(+)